MNPFHRWLKFNLVGLLGMAVQLTALALLNHFVPHHYLLTTTAALELTLLHNFLWHHHYTWRDRRTSSPLHQLLRFHLTNGSLSLLGTLTLMPLLLHTTRLHLLPANIITIATCSLANFLLSHHWTFRQHRTPPEAAANRGMLHSDANALPRHWQFHPPEGIQMQPVNAGFPPTTPLAQNKVNRG